MSTRYGKIEDMVVGLDVVLADGRAIHTGGWPRAAVGPDLTQLFVGSEGTLGIITGARLRLHPAPPAEQRAAYAFTGFAEGLDACRRILHRGATPAVIRLYDAIEGDRSFQTGPDRHVLLVMDEGDPLVVDAMMAVVADECAGAELLDAELVGQVARAPQRRERARSADPARLRGRHDGDLGASGRSARRSTRPRPRRSRAVPGALVASAHQSHSYPDGACLYFTFAGQPPAGRARTRSTAAAWEAGTRAVLAHGGALSHHHGVGLNRSRFVRDALGPAFAVLASVKQALDPNGILNPGKLGLPDPWGDPTWP